MSFLAPGWLLLGALAVVILALHMRRRRQLDVPSLMLWRLLEGSAAPRKSFRLPPSSILLLLQLATVALVAFALAQPLFGDFRAPVHSIYVLDASGSMRASDPAPSRFEAARARLAELIDANSGRPDNRVSVIVAGSRAAIEIARQPASGAAAALDRIRASDGAADWTGAAALVATVASAGERAALTVLTDGADEGAAALDTAFAGLTPRRIVVAGPANTNVGLEASIAPAANRPGRWTVSGTLRFAGEEPAVATVETFFRPEGAEVFVSWAKTEVKRRDGGVPTDFTQQLDLTGGGAVRVQLPNDVGPHDNAAYFLVRPTAPPMRVLYVGEAAGELVTALQAHENVELTASDKLPPEHPGYDLVVVDGVEVSRAPSTNTLWIGDARVAGQPPAAPLRDPYVTGWNPDHALSDGVDWTAVAPQRAYRQARLSGATILADASGLPLVQARTTARGREVRLAFRPQESGWVKEVGFPVFIGNLVRWLGARTATDGVGCIVGAPCALEARLISGKVIDPDGLDAWTLPATDGEYLLAGIERSFVPSRAGFHRLVLEGEERLLPVNVAAASELSIVPGATDGAGTSVGEARSPVIWWWLLLGALALLLIEAWIAGMGNEQFLKRAALAKGNPLALRRRLQLGARTASIVVLGVGLLGLPMLMREPAEQVVVVVGSHLGLGEAGGQRATVMKQVEANRLNGVNGQTGGVIAAGAETRVAGDLGAPVAPLAPESLRSDRPGANLENALALAAAMVPAGNSGRVVLAADGIETAGDLARIVAGFKARGIAVDIEPLTELQAGEVLIESVKAPVRVFAGDTFMLDAVVYSQGPSTAKLTAKREGVVLLDREVNLLAGRNRLESKVSAGQAGELFLEVTVESTRDHFPQNNTRGLMIEVAATASILIITPETEAGEFLAQALAVQGLTAKVVAPKGAPKKLDDFLVHDSVILMNMPAIALETEQQDHLAAFVEKHGRGLLILGGENSFGPGGYYGTPFERISPLSSRVKHEAPRVAIVFVLDRSGSMVGAVDDAGKITRLDIAKQATLTAVSLLNEDSQLGIVVFDSDAYVLLAMQAQKDEEAVKAALGPLIPGGGTAIFPGLALGLEMIAKVDASARHIVVMTDGLSQEADFAQLLALSKQAKITISAIAIGATADVRQPQEIAQKGGGAFYATEDFKALPSILAQETLMLQGTPVQERTAPVAWADRGAEFLAGLPDTLPPVRSYVRTTAQPQAQVHMTITEEDGDISPLLASWRVGNGRVLSFASHGAGVGTQDWSRLPEFPLLWAQAIRQFLPDAPGPGVHVGLHQSGDAVRVVADILGKDGSPLSGRLVNAVLTTGGGDEAVRLVEVRPGRYQGTISIDTPGTHRVSVTADDLKGAGAVHIAGPARYDFTRADFDKLGALASATGGRVLIDDDAVFGDELKWVRAPGWRLWAALALALFMLDLVIRHAPGLLGLRKKSARPAMAA